MSCCPSTGNGCKCPVQPCPSKCIVSYLPRIAFGLALAGYGINHYRGIDGFVMFAKSVFTVNAIAMISGVLAYVVPALMIVGGVLFAIRQLCCLSKICIVASLSGIIGWAGLAVMLADPNNRDVVQGMGSAIQNASVLFILYVTIKKMSCKNSCTNGVQGSCK